MSSVIGCARCTAVFSFTKHSIGCGDWMRIPPVRVCYWRCESMSLQLDVFCCKKTNCQRLLDTNIEAAARGMPWSRPDQRHFTNNTAAVRLSARYFWGLETLALWRLPCVQQWAGGGGKLCCDGDARVRLHLYW